MPVILLQFSFFPLLPTRKAALAFAPQISTNVSNDHSVQKSVQDGPAKSLVPLCLTCPWGCMQQKEEKGESITVENNWLGSSQHVGIYCTACRAALSCTAALNNAAQSLIMKFYCGGWRRDATLPGKVYTEQIQTLAACQLNLFTEGFASWTALRTEDTQVQISLLYFHISIRLGNFLLCYHVQMCVCVCACVRVCACVHVQNLARSLAK